jgi:ATP-dependent RNA helicase SUPV3L1/SUV3
MPIDEGASETPGRQVHDFSTLQGLQVVGSRLGPDEAGAESWQDALKLELEARASRFRQAVDSSIVLSDDGIVRWLGDPIAKLAAGSDLLTPRALILADASLPDAAREAVAARLDLWLTATMRRLLGPLAALQTLPDESESVRELGARIVASLGVLEREPMRSQIKALDQTSRAALRRCGVRFGAYYVYVPQSLKPAARALAIQLWGLQTPGGDGEELARALIPLVSSGRTSLPVDGSISKERYRLAGFRPCGERAVRVDIVERLSDMIRGALLPRPSSDPSRPASQAFLVSGQMTSLTGCSGETFATILRSLGFESFEVNRSELMSPQLPAEAALSATISPPPEGEAAHSAGGEADAVNADSVLREQTGAEEASAILDKDSETTHVQPDFPTEPIELAAPPLDDHASVSKAVGGSVAEGTVLAWRPARRRRIEATKRRSRREGPRPASDASANSVSSTTEKSGGEFVPHKRQKKGRYARDPKTDEKQSAQHGQKPDRSNRAQGREKDGRTSGKQSPAPSSNFERRREVAVDPTSPFAKLLELRMVLEKQNRGP